MKLPCDYHDDSDEDTDFDMTTGMIAKIVERGHSTSIQRTKKVQIWTKLGTLVVYEVTLIQQKFKLYSLYGFRVRAILHNPLWNSHKGVNLITVVPCIHPQLSVLSIKFRSIVLAYGYSLPFQSTKT